MFPEQGPRPLHHRRSAEIATHRYHPSNEQPAYRKRQSRRPLIFQYKRRPPRQTSTPTPLRRVPSRRWRMICWIASSACWRSQCEKGPNELFTQSGEHEIRRFLRSNVPEYVSFRPKGLWNWVPLICPPFALIDKFG